MAVFAPARDPTVADPAWSVLERLAGLERPPGSEGERHAAQTLAVELRARGARTRIEPERVHGTYWIPIGLGCSAGALAAVAPRIPGALLAGTAAASVADDLAIGRRPLRRLLAQRIAHNVIGEYGPVGAAPTLVIHAHHDAAHTGLVFHPARAKLAARLAGGLMERLGTTPVPMRGAVAGPGLVAFGQLLGSRRLRHLGAALSAGYAAAMVNIWRSPAVPAANDNLSAESGVSLREPFTYRLATDGQVPLRPGYPTAVISSMDWYRAPSHYHWPTDRPENLDRGSLDGAVRLARAFVCELDRPSPMRVRPA